MLDGAKFWINCQRLRILRKASHWQLIQNSAPSTIVWRQCDIRIVWRNILAPKIICFQNKSFLAPKYFVKSKWHEKSKTPAVNYFEILLSRRLRRINWGFDFKGWMIPKKYGVVEQNLNFHHLRAWNDLVFLWNWPFMVWYWQCLLPICDAINPRSI